MLLVTRQALQEAIAGIEWPTLFFLIGLFVMVGALEETGALDYTIIVAATASPAPSPALTWSTCREAGRVWWALRPFP